MPNRTDTERREWIEQVREYFVGKFLAGDCWQARQYEAAHPFIRQAIDAAMDREELAEEEYSDPCEEAMQPGCWEEYKEQGDG